MIAPAAARVIANLLPHVPQRLMEKLFARADDWEPVDALECDVSASNWAFGVLEEGGRLKPNRTRGTHHESVGKTKRTIDAGCDDCGK